MEEKSTIIQNRGMWQDYTISKTPEGFAYENMNIDILSNRDGNQLAVTAMPTINEDLLEIKGGIRGACKLNDLVILFTQDDVGISRIYKVDEEQAYRIYMGRLGFSEHIECLPYYESENVQKVYWIDGKNQPKFINIVNNKIYSFCTTDNSFTYNVDVTKDYSMSGLFSQGTIQYFITEYDKFGSETQILWQSSIQYISHKNRGAKADENVSCSFIISINSLASTFEYLRLYAAHRTTQNGPVELRVVEDIDITKYNYETLKIIDDGIKGYLVDSNLLYFIGGDEIIPSTMAQKDNTLFFGDIKQNSQVVPDSIRTALTPKEENKYSCDGLVFKTKEIKAPEQKGYYSHEQEINHSAYNICTFKFGEIYSFAVQFMSENGKWSEPIFVGCQRCNVKPTYSNGFYSVASATYTLPNKVKNLCVICKYVKYRLLVEQKDYNTREIIAQGVVNPTMFNFYERYYNMPHSINSWIFRPRNGGVANRNLQGINTQYDENAEIQGVKSIEMPLMSQNNGAIFDYFNIVIGFDGGHEITSKLILYNLPNTTDVSKQSEAKQNIEEIMNGTRKLPKYVKGTDQSVTGCYYEVNTGYSNTGKWSKTIDDIWSQMDNACTEFMKSQDKTSLTGVPISRGQMVTSGEAKKIMSWQFGTKIWASVAIAIVTVAMVAVSAVSFGSAAPAAGILGEVALQALISIASTITIVTKTLVCLSIAVLGAAAMSKEIVESAEYSEIEKQLAKKGWFYLGQKSDLKLGDLFDGLTDFYKFKGTDNGSFWCTGGALTFKDEKTIISEANKNQYYIDESVVSFNSPDIDNIADIINDNTGLSLRIVGIIPIDASYSDYLIETENAGYSKNADVINGVTTMNKQIGSVDTDGLISDYLYQDSDLTKGRIDDNGCIHRISQVDKFKVFMWNRETSLSVGGAHSAQLLYDDESYIEANPAQLKRKIFANMKYSFNTEYFGSQIWTPKFGIDTPVYFDSDSNILTGIDDGDYEKLMYNGNYDSVVVNSNPYEIITANNCTYSGSDVNNRPEVDITAPYNDDRLKVTDPVRIRYKSTPHVVIKFKRYDNEQPILPRLNGDKPYSLGTLHKLRSGQWYYEVDKQDLPEAAYNNNTYILGTGSDYAFLGETLLNPQVNTLEVTPTDEEIIGDGEYKFSSPSSNYTLMLNQLNNICNTDDSSVISMLASTHKLIICVRVYTKTYSSEHFYMITDINVVSRERYIKIYRLRENQLVPAKIIGYKGGISYYSSYKYRIKEDGSYSIYYGTYNYTEDQIYHTSPNNQYLFIGELYKPLFDESSIRTINKDLAKWNICSGSVTPDSTIKTTWGDTYYQRWDCLKTYPYTEEDKNGVVDILSFMVETYRNIDGRCDTNRGLFNILNARPTNWNLMNDSYTQIDNLIQYSTLDSKFRNDRYKNQIIWSQKKVDLSDIDTWANINTLSTLSLDGSHGNITKLENVNDTIVAFQDKAISAINFNVRTQLSTESGMPVELANSGKVDGYTVITDQSGCSNKLTITQGNSGVYFMDDYNNAFMRFNKSGIENLGVKCGMSTFFKNNTIERCVFDEDESVMYIVGDFRPYNGARVVSFNENTDTFVSFHNTMNDLVYIFKTTYPFICTGYEESVNISNRNYLSYADYYMKFRFNPEPFEDKIFTNIDYNADMVDNYGKITDDNPFSKIEVDTEYQHGEEVIPKYTSLSIRNVDMRKFRTKRIQIPRDNNSRFKLDRIRNQWCFVKLSGDASKNKLLFHQGVLKYFK